ncbi:MAG TPA: hypothetical protein DIV86_02715 [Alphaproteobacteria bacterium]|mgnify:CR=1 FL=1|nr:hypothetical protein [Alphaproteobacteria bacterium]
MFKRKKNSNQEQPQEDSVDSILSKIKNVVSGKENVKIDDEDVTSKRRQVKEVVEEEEPLELTEIVGGDETNENNEAVEEASILEKILEGLSPENLETTSSETSEQANVEEEGFVDVLKQIDEEFEASNLQIDTPDEAITSGNVAEEVLEVTSVTQNIIEETNFDIESELAKNNLEDEIVEDSIGEVMEEELENDELPPVVEERPEIIQNQTAKQMVEDINVKQAVVSDEVALKATASIKQLVDSIPKPKIDSPSFASGATLEDLVLLSLKPMLKEWLDKNLDVIVRDIVQREIRKLIPRE